tara:strand:- start:140 stop:2734 length:2595 start_codon:yes stop_codon:yes gene_type:complete
MQLIDKILNKLLANIENINIPQGCTNTKYIVTEKITGHKLLYDPELHYLKVDNPKWYPLILMPNSIYLVTENSATKTESHVNYSFGSSPLPSSPIHQITDKLYGINIPIPSYIKPYSDFNLTINNQTFKFYLEDWGAYGTLGTIFNSKFNTNTKVTISGIDVSFNYLNSVYCNNRFNSSYCNDFKTNAINSNVVMPLDFILYNNTFIPESSLNIMFSYFTISLNNDYFIEQNSIILTSRVTRITEPFTKELFDTSQQAGYNLKFLVKQNNTMSYTIPIQSVFSTFDHIHYLLNVANTGVGSIAPPFVHSWPGESSNWNNNNNNPWNNYAIDYMSFEGGYNYSNAVHKQIYNNIGDSQQILYYIVGIPKPHPRGLFSNNGYFNNIFNNTLSIPSIINDTSINLESVYSNISIAQAYSNIIITNKYLKLPWGWDFSPALKNPYNINITNKKSSDDIISLNSIFDDVSFTAIYDSLTTFNDSEELLQGFLPTFYYLDTSLGMMSINDISSYFDSSYIYSDGFINKGLYRWNPNYSNNTKFVVTQEIQSGIKYLVNSNNDILIPQLNMPIHNTIRIEASGVSYNDAQSGWNYNYNGKTISTAYVDISYDSTNLISDINFQLNDTSNISNKFNSSAFPYATSFSSIAVNASNFIYSNAIPINEKLYHWSVDKLKNPTFLINIVNYLENPKKGWQQLNSPFNTQLSNTFMGQLLPNGVLDMSDVLIYRPDLAKEIGVTYYTTKYNPLDKDASNITAKIIYQWVDFSQQVAMRAFKFRLLTSIANFNSIMKRKITKWSDANPLDISNYKAKIDSYFVKMNQTVNNLHMTKTYDVSRAGYAKLNNPRLDNSGHEGQIAEIIDISWNIGLPPS